MSQIILNIATAGDKIYDDSEICCYLADVSLPREFILSLREKGKMVLLAGNGAPELCASLGLDGVITEVSPDYPVKAQLNKVRGIIGNRKVLGALIPPRRHEAMLAAETEPEFVAFRFSAAEFEAAAEVVRWYNEYFLIQSAVDLRDGLQDVKGWEADFVIINSRDYEDFSC